jgi:hypothetical protein
MVDTYFPDSVRKPLGPNKFGFGNPTFLQKLFHQEFSVVQSKQMTGSLLVMTCYTWILSVVHFHSSSFYSMVWCTNNLR